MQKILVSACLLGDRVRYDGQSKVVSNSLVSTWHREGRLVKVCPEAEGGLPTPRDPAEIQSGSGESVIKGAAKVLTKPGREVTAAFIKGAEIALQQAQTHQIKLALLKANSPSCGNKHIYNGQFNGVLHAGEGVTAAMLRANGVQVFNETELLALEAALRSIETLTK